MVTRRIDLHVHTARYSGCAEFVDPYRIGEAAAAAGLDGVLLTDHDMMWEVEELEVLQAATPGVRLYRGIEVSAAGCHLVVLGIDDAGALTRGITLAEAADITHRAGGIVILAHPFRDSDPYLLPVELVDAIEIASTSFTAAESRAAADLVRRFGKPPVASSDGHALSRIGWAWTELSELPVSERALGALIASGAGLPVHPFG